MELYVMVNTLNMVDKCALYYGTCMIKHELDIYHTQDMNCRDVTSYYNSSSVCLFVCVFVPYLLRGPLMDLRQTWRVYVGGPPIYP